MSQKKVQEIIFFQSPINHVRGRGGAVPEAIFHLTRQLIDGCWDFLPSFLQNSIPKRANAPVCTCSGAWHFSGTTFFSLRFESGSKLLKVFGQVRDILPEEGQQQAAEAFTQLELFSRWPELDLGSKSAAAKV